MKPTQEQVIALAREALNEASGTDYYDYTGEVHWWGEVKSIVSFATLAYEAGRKDERDEAPAKAVEWQGLTDEEIKRWKPVCADFESFRAGIRAIEAKLKEKNSA